MLSLPSTLKFSNGQEISSSNFHIEQKNDIYFLICPEFELSIFQLNGSFFTGSSPIIDINNNHEALHLSQETLDKIKVKTDL